VMVEEFRRYEVRCMSRDLRYTEKFKRYSYMEHD